MIRARRAIAAIVVVFATSIASVAAADLTPDLTGVSFLLGSWTSQAGTVADSGRTSRGTSTFSSEAGGSAVLRRDHTDVLGTDGKPVESFDQLMMIYSDGGTLHADYADGTHIIHYTSATVVPGRSVAFTSAGIATAPTFRLTYEKSNDTTLSVHFDMQPPGQTAFIPIASGTLQRPAPASP